MESEGVWGPYLELRSVTWQVHGQTERVIASGGASRHGVTNSAFRGVASQKVLRRVMRQMRTGLGRVLKESVYRLGPFKSFERTSYTVQCFDAYSH